MTGKKTQNAAQIVDHFIQRTAIGVTLIALQYGASTAAYLMDDTAQRWIGRGSLALSILIIILVLPAFLRYFQLRKRNRAGCRGAESYMLDTFRQAGLWAFSFTFILLQILMIITEKGGIDLPAAFFVKLALTGATGSLGLSFFFMTRGGDENDDFGDDQAAE